MPALAGWRDGFASYGGSLARFVSVAGAPAGRVAPIPRGTGNDGFKRTWL
jgi:hypothetical protein